MFFIIVILGGGSCYDTQNVASNCPTWKNSGYCSSSSNYYNYMRANCERTCGFCSSGSSSNPGFYLFYIFCLLDLNLITYEMEFLSYEVSHSW